MIFVTTSGTLKAGANLNTSDQMRNANMLCFPSDGDRAVAGDLHHHDRNFQRIQKYADLDNDPLRQVILQALIRVGPLNKEGADSSIDMLLDAIRWAQDYPGRVHFLL